MIYPKTVLPPDAIARHYDECDPFYREIWGEHLHHGFWDSLTTTPSEAVQKLVERIAEEMEISPGERVCDIGCGYGATARMLAEQWKAEVTGVTLSQTQYEWAKGKGKATYLLGDWLSNPFPNQSFNHLLAIESSEHMADKERFFTEAFRLLAPKGNLAVTAWLSKEKPSSWEIRYLLEPICRESCLPSLGSSEEYVGWMKRAGFTSIQFQDWSSQVKKTWTICGWRVFRALFTDRALRALVKDPVHRAFVKSIYRIWLAYNLGSMHYGFFLASKV